MYLVVVKGPNTGSTFTLGKEGPIIIGRNKTCDIQLLDMVISREHCQVERKENTFYIKDLQSTNKTMVNKKVIEGEIALKNGDSIEIGNTLLLFTNWLEKGTQNKTQIILK